jgi:hypothetical protein
MKEMLPMAKKQAADAEVQISRRKDSDRRGEDRRKKGVAVAVERRLGERRIKTPRRRQIDPTTCERDYSDAEVEFMNALDEYKRKSGRMFPTCSEILEVIVALGYEKRCLATGISPVETTDGSSALVTGGSPVLMTNGFPVEGNNDSNIDSTFVVA